MANDASFPTDTGTFSRRAIFTSAQTRWLSVEEVIAVLNDAKEDEYHRRQYGVPKPGGPIIERQTAPPTSPPPSGTVLLYDRVAVRNYKVDGHKWVRKRSNPTKIREDHVKLRFNGIYRISGTYVHSDEIDTLHRRVYRLLKNAEEKAAIAYGGPIKQEFVLVQYLDTEQAANIASMTAPSKRKSSRRITKNSKRFRSSRSSSSCSSSNSNISSSSSSYSGSDEEYQPTKAAAATAASPSFHKPQAHKKQRRDNNVLSKAIDKRHSWNPHLASPFLTNDFGRIRPKCTSSDGLCNDASLDDVHFDDLWDIIESDAGLGRGLETLIDPRVDKVVEQVRKQEQEKLHRSESSSPNSTCLGAVTKESPFMYANRSSNPGAYKQHEKYMESQDFRVANAPAAATSANQPWCHGTGLKLKNKNT